MSFKKTKLYRLYGLLTKVSKEERPRILYITDNQLLRSYDGSLSFHEFIKPHGIITHLSPDRESILDIFSKIEFIVNEILLNAIEPKNKKRQDEMLDFLDLFTKIKLLSNWSLVDKRIKEKLFCLKEVRNGFAHNWSERDVEYKSQGIENNFEDFRRDLLEIWLILIGLSQSMISSVDELIRDVKKIIIQK